MARSEKSAKTPARRAKSKATASATQSSLALRQDGNGRDPVSSSALRRAKRASGLEREEKRAVRKKKGETRTDFLRASRLSSASREGAAKKRKKTSCPLSRKKAALSSLATGRRASHLARKDREAGQGPATTRKTGEETSSKDGEDRASQDGEDRASKDGEETCSKDGEDRASKDGEEASSKDGEDISSKDRVSEEERKGGDVRARQKPEHAPQTLRRNGLPEFDEKHCMAASSRESLSSFSPSLPSFSSWFPTEEPPSACVPQESRLVRAGWASGREERCEDVLASRRGLPAKTRAGFDAPECTYSGAWCECWRDGGPSPPLLAPCVESGRFSACCRCDASRLDREGLCAQDGGAQALGVSHALAGCACVAAFCPVATRPTSPRPRRWGPFSESPTCGGESDSDEEFSGFKRLRILDVDARGGFGASGVITVIDQAAFQRSLADALLQRQLASLPRPDWGGASDARPGKLRKTLAETVPRKAAESARETGSAALRADLPTSSPFAAAGPPRSPSRAAEKTSTHRQALRHRPGSGRAVAVSPSCHGTGESPLQSPDQDQGSRNDASLAPSVRESASSLCSSSLSHDSQSPKKIRSATGGEEGSRRDGAATEAERETRTDDQTATRNTGELCSESVEGEGNRPSSRHLSSRRWFPSPARLNAQQRTLCEFLLRVAARRERLERAGRYLSSLPLPRVSLEALEQAQRRLARLGDDVHAAVSEADKVTGEGRKRGDKGEKRNRQREEGDSLVGAVFYKVGEEK
ncbi:conserved hypothetical protein [Neospora caninum Liverpool]|uniref:Uncharacterized protein n=1 Tax=Neospora caninum (strain Liverpool) TaxID=572307 RepID=F0VD76_NEOCL|nr:conserved hypothetical protein [Neospora caninum Liverpool]CBZ51591.1 conserved hypothetical protein [Neospora caninum Liverpool]|eukprot:XP_003881624.1 conserved hypothetical protein [Neospora caninum Liverpool]